MDRALLRKIYSRKVNNKLDEICCWRIKLLNVNKQYYHNKIDKLLLELGSWFGVEIPNIVPTAEIKGYIVEKINERSEDANI